MSCRAAAAADGDGRQLLELAAERLLQANAIKAASSSTYDYVKIKVRLGSNLEHYYILSRFLLSRMLTVITLPQHKAVRIALDVKKHLVDHDRLDITQEELEEVLFAILWQKGYGDEYVRLYQMVTRFFQQKRPLIILIAGSACTGKSSLAQQLASRLNLPNVLQTDILYELLRASGDGDVPAQPLWRRQLLATDGGMGGSSSSSSGSLFSEFRRECATIRRALDGDLCKCIRDGKSIIIEGLHIDPGLFLEEFGNPRASSSDGGGASHGFSSGPDVTTGQRCALEAPVGMQGAAAAALQPGAAGGFEAASTAAADVQFDGLQEANGADAACSSTPAEPLQQGSATAAGALAASAPAQPSQASLLPPIAEPWSLGVRRTASFNDAVQSLNYGGQHRLESPWRGEGSRRPQLRRPSSARVHSSADRGRAVFMLQSMQAADDCDAGSTHGNNISGSSVIRLSSSGGSSGVHVGAGAAAAAPVLSPRLATCASLPNILVYNAEAAPVPTRPHSAELSSTPRSSGSGVPIQVAEPSAAASAATGAMQQLAGSSRQSAPSDQQAAQRAEGGAAGAPDAPAGAVAAVQQRPPSSVAAADAAAAAAAGTGPVFVPICLAIPEAEYEGLLQDWLTRQQQAGSYSCSLADDSAAGAGAVEECGQVADDTEAVRRLRQLQDHMRRYAAGGVPVVEININDMGQALDSMHAYVLQCIALALN